MSVTTTPAIHEREQVILNHLPQVKLIASRLKRRCPHGVLLEDLESAGVLGLLQAYQRFDGSRNLKLKTLAEHRIRGAMLDYLRGLDPLPRAVRRFVKDRELGLVNLIQRFGVEPSEQALATEMGLSVETYRQFRLKAKRSIIVSLDKPTGGDAQAWDTATANSKPTHDAVLLRQVEDAIQQLPNC